MKKLLNWWKNDMLGWQENLIKVGFWIGVVLLLGWMVTK